MKLARLRIRNFRCFKDEIAFDFEEMTAFVGKNDVGKSTVMDALDIFLNDGTPDKNDASKNGDGKDLTIICEFTDLPDEAIIDDNVPTTFHSEHLLNTDGYLVSIRKPRILDSADARYGGKPAIHSRGVPVLVLDFR